MILTQEMVASSVFSVTEIITIESHKLYCTFFYVTFMSQSQLSTMSDLTSFDSN
jgi:hypothetical protein